MFPRFILILIFSGFLFLVGCVNQPGTGDAGAAIGGPQNPFGPSAFESIPNAPPVQGTPGTLLSPEQLANNPLRPDSNPFGEEGFRPVGPVGLNEGTQDVGGNCLNQAVTKDQINSWVARDGSTDPSIIYVFVPTPLLNGNRAKEASVARVGFMKALYHTSFLKDIQPFEDISEKHCAVYKVDLKNVWGADWQRNAQFALGSQPLQDRAGDPARQPYARFSQEELNDQRRRLYNAARIAFNLFYPTNYNALIKAPQNTSQISRQQPIVATGGYADGIPCGPRILHVRQALLQDGTSQIYFQAADPSNVRFNFRGDEQFAVDRAGANKASVFPSSPPRRGVAGSGLITLPSRQISGSESILPLPNGLLRYYVWRNPGTLGTKALRSGVIDPANVYNGHMLVSGMSCIGCHNNGIRGVPVDTGEMGNGWATQDQMTGFFTTARAGYREGMGKIVNFISDAPSGFKEALTIGNSREPVSFLIDMMNQARLGNRNQAQFFGQRCGSGKYQRQISSWAQSINSLDESIRE